MPRNQHLDETVDGESHQHTPMPDNGKKKHKEEKKRADKDDAKKSKKKDKKKKNKKRKSKSLESEDDPSGKRSEKRRKGSKEDKTWGNETSTGTTPDTKRHFPFEYEHILAPMVGASELAFRLLCRKYGATLSYTPMMSSSQFAKEAEKKLNDDPDPEASVANCDVCEFQTIPEDRPLCVHFSANDPEDFARAAKLVEPHCDAVDLNLGCPQRTAFLGHFGSYLLGDKDRKLVLDIVRAGSRAVSIPIFVKIRLLDSVEETIELCHQLRDAGASLIAIHARYRASWERTGLGARDGPALLDQVALVKRSMPDFPIISNGNITTYDDVVANKESTGANGIMSAEGILNNPALYLPRLEGGDGDIEIPILSPLRINEGPDEKKDKAIRKLQKKLREIESIKTKVKKLGKAAINEDQRKKLEAKSKIKKELKELEKKSTQSFHCTGTDSPPNPRTRSVKLSELSKAANNKLILAKEYLSLVRSYPTKIRSVVFHTRRMCKDLLERYQLMEECIACATIDEVEGVLAKCQRYAERPETFRYDREKAARDKEALDRKRREEGKRKAYEARMVRKSKREGLADLEHYLRVGAEVPTVEAVTRLKCAPKEERLAAWKKDHSQHCMAYHLEDAGCTRDRACAFLHVEAKDKNKFVEDDEVAG